MTNKPTSIPQTYIDEWMPHAGQYDQYSPWQASDDFELEDDDFDFRIYTEMKIDYDHRLADDGDWFGVVEVVWYQHQPERPKGFNGAARILHRDKYKITWWQPPADLLDTSDPENATRLRNLEASLREVLEYGYRMAHLVVEYKCPCCETWSLFSQSWLGGLYPMQDIDADIAAGLIDSAEANDYFTVTP